MTRTALSVCGSFLLTISSIPVLARQAPVVESTPQTVTATIESIDKANRTITLKGVKGDSVEIKAPDEMEGFNSLRVGDQVTATYYEAVVVNVRKPGAPAPSSPPVVMTERKDRVPGSETRRQQTFTVTIEAIDEKAPSVTVKGPQGRVVTLAVRDPKQLKSVKVGDTVDVTYYESLLIKTARPAKQYRPISRRVSGGGSGRTHASGIVRAKHGYGYIAGSRLRALPFRSAPT